MKTWKKIILGVSLISLFLGGGLVAWGYSQGGLTDLQNQTKSEQDYVKKEVENFNKIDIKSSSYNVLIKNGDVDKTTLSYYQKTKNPIDTSVKDGQLTINDNNSELLYQTVKGRNHLRQNRCKRRSKHAHAKRKYK